MIGICVFWFAIVSLFSSQTGAESGKVSEKVTKKLLEIKDKLEIVVEHYQDTNEIIIKGIQIQPSTKKRIDKWEVSVRKMAHFMLFLCGGFLIYWILKVYSIKMAGVRAVILGMFLSGSLIAARIACRTTARLITLSFICASSCFYFSGDSACRFSLREYRTILN